MGFTPRHAALELGQTSIAPPSAPASPPAGPHKCRPDNGRPQWHRPCSLTAATARATARRAGRVPTGPWPPSVAPPVPSSAAGRVVQRAPPQHLNGTLNSEQRPPSHLRPHPRHRPHGRTSADRTTAALSGTARAA